MTSSEHSLQSSDDPWMDGWFKGSATMKESCDGNSQQQAVVTALYEPLRNLIDEHGAGYGLNHDQLLHVLYPSQIEYGPVTRVNADWEPGLSFGLDEYGTPSRLVAHRVYR